MNEKNDYKEKNFLSKIQAWATDNIVTVIFVLFVLFGFMVSKGFAMDFFMRDLLSRFFRNAFIVISLIVPIMAGLGLNFGIVIGAMAGQIALAVAVYFQIGGVPGILLCFVLSIPLALLFGYFTGVLFNKTKGQEMIASLIVGYFADGLYQFLFLFVVGVVIPVSATNPIIKSDGVGIRTTIDLGGKDGLKYAIDNIYKIPFLWAVAAGAVILAGFLLYGYAKKRKAKQKSAPMSLLIFELILCALALIYSLYAMAVKNDFVKLEVPVVTSVLIVLVGIFTSWIMKTKLGQDFRSVGQSQHVSQVSGIDVNRRRSTATMISTLLAAWGQIIYMQNMGTLNTYFGHTQIGMFSVAALLVGGASLSKASVKHAILGTVLFNSMFIISPEIGKALFGNALLGEYFRTFMVYGVIGVALGLYVWKANKKKQEEQA